MSAELVASFILKLEDQLSGGIAAIAAKLDALAKLAKGLAMPGLDVAGKLLDKLGGAADAAGKKVEGIGASARRVAADLKKLAQPIVVPVAVSAQGRRASAAAAMPGIAVPMPEIAMPGVSLAAMEAGQAVMVRLAEVANGARLAVDAIGGAAERTGAKLKRLAQPILVNAAGVATLLGGPQRAALAGLVAAGVAAGGVGGIPRLPPPLPPPSRPAPLLLTGPAGAGIPLPAMRPAPLLLTGPAGAGIPLPALDVRSMRLASVEGALNRVGAAAGHVVAKLGAMHAAIAGLSLAVPIQRAAAYDQQLRDIALTGETAKAEVPAEIARLRGILDPMARQTGQSNTGLGEAMSTMIGKGMAAPVIEQMMPVVARLATASNSSPGMLATLAYTMGQNLRIGPEQLNAALGGMLIAGKAGGFELKDMAQHFPAVAVAGGMLGLRGARGAASLAALAQVSADVAGPNEPGEAATGMKHFLGSLTSPAGRKHWKEQGVDVTRMLTAAREQGVDPIVAVVGKLQKLTAGKNPEQAAATIGAIFHDEYTRRTALSLLNDPAKYLRIRDAASNTTDLDPRKNANLVIGHDFEVQMEGLSRRLATIKEGFSQLLLRFGLEIFGGQTSLPLRALEGMEAAVGWLDKNAPGSVHWIANIGAAAIAAVGVLGLVGPVAARGLGMLGTVVKVGLLQPLGWARVALTAWWVSATGGIGMLAAGTAVGVAAVAAGMLLLGAAVYREWDTIAPGLERIWTGLGGVLQGVFTGDQQVLMGGFRDIADGLRTVFEGLDRGIRGATTSFVAWVDGLTNNALSGVLATIERQINRLLRILGMGGTGNEEGATALERARAGVGGFVNPNAVRDPRGEAEAGGGGGFAPTTPGPPRDPFRSELAPDQQGPTHQDQNLYRQPEAKSSIDIRVTAAPGTSAKVESTDLARGTRITGQDLGDMSRHD